MKRKILNVGCGNETYGTHYIDLYPQRDNVIKCDVDRERLPFPDNYFDEVYSKNLLEHLRNPGFALEEMKRVCKKNGRIVLITDNASFWEFHLLGTHVTPKIPCRRLEFYKGYGELDTHFCLFTKEHLVNHFKRIGLKIESIEYIDFDGNLEDLGKFRPILNLFNFLLRKIRILKNLTYPRIKIIGRKTL